MPLHNGARVHDMLARRAVTDGDWTALIHGEDRTTFAQLHDRVRRLAAALLGCAQPGDRVAILADNCVAYVEAYYAVPAAGMVLATLNTRLAPAELHAILDLARPAVLITEARWLRTLDERRLRDAGVRTIATIDAGGHTIDLPLPSEGPAAVPDVGPEERAPAILVFTSGTTGRPKGVVVSHLNLLTHLANTAAAIPAAGDSVFMMPWPMFHVAGFVIFEAHHQACPVVLLPRFTVEDVLDAVEGHGVTDLRLAPTMLAMLLEDPRSAERDLSSVTRFVYGAAPMPPDLLRRAMARLPGAEFVTGFGMTESTGALTFLDGRDHRRALEGRHDLLGSVGRVAPFAAIRIADDTGRDVPTGQVGELVMRGPQVTGGYWDDPAATAEATLGGWFRTGDLARMDADGYVTIVDRKKDMIVTGGENVYSREVEEALLAHPAVGDAAVVGLPHHIWGEEVTAVVMLRPDEPTTPEDLVAHCRTLIAGYKVPRRVVFVDDFPRNATGKILKHLLRARFAALSSVSS